jgi:hypothetical protein
MFRELHQAMLVIGVMLLQYLVLSCSDWCCSQFGMPSCGGFTAVDATALNSSKPKSWRADTPFDRSAGDFDVNRCGQSMFVI